MQIKTRQVLLPNRLVNTKHNGTVLADYDLEKKLDGSVNVTYRLYLLKLKLCILFDSSVLPLGFCPAEIKALRQILKELFLEGNA